jgi:hypothetical protein
MIFKTQNTIIQDPDIFNNRYCYTKNVFVLKTQETPEKAMV